MSGESSSRVPLVVLALVLACKEPAPELPTQAEPQRAATSERDELRADAREGFELALADPALDRAFERAFTRLASAPEVVDASEKLLARVALEPKFERSSADFFASLQATPIMRAALAEYARANPSVEIDAIAAGFISHVDARLTRPELVAELELALVRRLGAAGHALGAALLVEAGGAARLADRVADRLVDPGLAAALDQRLGSDPNKRADRLHRHLSDAHRALELELALASALGEAEGVALFEGLLDDETLAPAFADALVRVLDDPGFRDQVALVFEQALAPELDAAALRRELDALLGLAVVEREAAASLAELARLASVRARVDAFVDQVTAGPEFEARLLDAIE